MAPSDPLFSTARLRKNLQRARSMDGNRYFLCDRFLYDTAISSLMDRIAVIKKPIKRVLVLGCGLDHDKIAASLRDQIQNINNSAITFLDPFYAPGNLEDKMWQRDGTFPASSADYDLVINFFGLAVTENVPALMRSIYESLKPDRPFLGVILGGDSFMDLRRILYDVDLDLYGGVRPRVHPMITAKDAFHVLESTGFSLPIVDTTKLTAQYPTIGALALDLRFHGMTNSLRDQSNHPTSPSFWHQVERRYGEKSDGGGLAVSYDLIFLQGWRP